MQYRIISEAGVDHGVWDGDTPAEALAAQHTDAGYPCVANGDDVRFLDDSHLDADGGSIAGYVDDWIFETA